MEDGCPLPTINKLGSVRTFDCSIDEVNIFVDSCVTNESAGVAEDNGLPADTEQELADFFQTAFDEGIVDDKAMNDEMEEEKSLPEWDSENHLPWEEDFKTHKLELAPQESQKKSNIRRPSTEKSELVVDVLGEALQHKARGCHQNSLIPDHEQKKRRKQKERKEWTEKMDREEARKRQKKEEQQNDRLNELEAKIKIVQDQLARALHERSLLVKWKLSTLSHSLRERRVPGHTSSYAE